MLVMYLPFQHVALSFVPESSYHMQFLLKPGFAICLTWQTWMISLYWKITVAHGQTLQSRAQIKYIQKIYQYIQWKVNVLDWIENLGLETKFKHGNKQKVLGY